MDMIFTYMGMTHSSREDKQNRNKLCFIKYRWLQNPWYHWPYENFYEKSSIRCDSCTSLYFAVLRCYILCNHLSTFVRHKEYKIRTVKIKTTWFFINKNVVNPNPFKRALDVSPHVFFIWIRALNHNKYVEIKQFSKVDIKKISTVILLIKFLVFQWDPRHLQGK